MTTENKPTSNNVDVTTSTPPATDKKGLQVGNYVLEQKLGQGGMSEVWKGRHQVLGTFVAIKFLTDELAGNADLEQRFLGEGKKQAQLSHPNIVSAFDFINEAGRSYLVMKFIEGEALEELMFRLQAPLPLSQSLGIATDVLHALDYAHSKGVVHRDIKPANILLEQGGRALVMDFGIALVVGEQRQTRAGVAVGTPQYMSPEQITGAATIDRRSDIYSFGCVLYQMLTAKPPFESDGEGDTEYVIKEKHLRQKPVPPRQWNPYIPEHIEQAVLRCLEKNTADRFDSCQDLLAALSTPAEPVPSRTDTVVEKLPQRSDTIVEKVNAPTPPPEAIAPPVPPRKAEPPVPFIPPPQTPPTNQSPRPAQDLSAIWILCTAMLSVALVGGLYFYIHHRKPTLAPIIDNPQPAPNPGGTTPKPSPQQPIEVKKDDGTQPPDQPQPDQQPTPHTPPTPDMQMPDPSSPTPDAQPPVTKPDTPTPTPKTEPTPQTPVVVTPPAAPAPSNPVPKPSVPARQYAHEGDLIWSGQVDKNQVIQIFGSSANIGQLSGTPFPGNVPIQVSVSSPNFAVIGQPNPFNHFSQMSLRSTIKGNISITVHWKVLAND